MKIISKTSICVKIGISVKKYAYLGNVFMLSND